MRLPEFNQENGFGLPVMTRENPSWRVFCELLYAAGPCDCSNSRPNARAVLNSMQCDVERSLAYFEENGGHCDCEVLMNVDIDEKQRDEAFEAYKATKRRW